MFTETSSLWTLKIMSRNLNEFVCSWIRLLGHAVHLFLYILNLTHKSLTTFPPCLQFFNTLDCTVPYILYRLKYLRKMKMQTYYNISNKNNCLYTFSISPSFLFRQIRRMFLISLPRGEIGWLQIKIHTLLIKSEV